jgi:hypothetical protein
VILKNVVKQNGNNKINCRFTTHPGNVYSFYVSERVTNFKPSGKFNCSQTNTFSNYTRCLEKYVGGVVEQKRLSGNTSGKFLK